MRTHLYSSLAALKIGLDILFKEEKVQADEIFGHGGLFKTKGVGQGILAAAMNDTGHGHGDGGGRRCMGDCSAGRLYAEQGGWGNFIPLSE